MPVLFTVDYDSSHIFWGVFAPHTPIMDPVSVPFCSPKKAPYLCLRYMENFCSPRCVIGFVSGRSSIPGVLFAHQTGAPPESAAVHAPDQYHRRLSPDC